MDIDCSNRARKGQHKNQNKGLEQDIKKANRAHLAVKISSKSSTGHLKVLQPAGLAIFLYGSFTQYC